eukprot:Gb_04950 [translate_table: standard]
MDQLETSEAQEEFKERIARHGAKWEAYLMAQEMSKTTEASLQTLDSSAKDVVYGFTPTINKQAKSNDVKKDNCIKGNMDQAFTAPLSSAFPAFSLALTAKGLLPCHRIRFKIHWRFKTRAIKSPLLSGNGAKDISMCVSILSKATLQGRTGMCARYLGSCLRQAFSFVVASHRAFKFLFVGICGLQKQFIQLRGHQTLENNISKQSLSSSTLDRSSVLKTKETQDIEESHHAPPLKFEEELMIRIGIIPSMFLVGKTRACLMAKSNVGSYPWPSLSLLADEEGMRSMPAFAICLPCQESLILIAGLASSSGTLLVMQIG